MVSVNCDSTYMKQLISSNNLVKGSHVSFESALYYYGLVQKASSEVLAVGVTKKVTKPSGVFRYYNLRNCSCPDAISKIRIERNKTLFIASKEKAIADILVRPQGRTIPQFQTEFELEFFFGFPDLH